MVKMPSKKDLPGFFAWLADQEVDGVKGLHRIKVGNKPTQRHAAFAMTHGKEPAGLAFQWFVYNNAALFTDLDLTIGISNLEAAKRYFASTPTPTRFIDVDMNRMQSNFPADVTTSSPYEYQRVAELVRTLPGLTSLFDAHSTDQDTTGLGIDIKGSRKNTNRLMDGLLFRDRLCGITPIQASQGTRTLPFGAVFDCQTALEIEASQHESPEGLVRAVLNGCSWLGALNCTTGSMFAKPAGQDVYTVLNSVMVPNKDITYEMVDDSLLDMFRPIKEGQVIARNPQGQEVISPATGLAIFGPSTRTLDLGDVSSELLWIVSEKEERARAIAVPEWLMDFMPK